MPKSRQTRWFAALAALVVFVLLAWLLGAVLTLTPGEQVALRVALVALGLAAAVSFLWFLRPTDQPQVAATPAQKDDALLALEAARARVGRGAFDASPLVLVLGTEGSAKTTVVTRAGLEADLLAGDAAAGDRPAPTAAVNLWKVRGAVLAEAGGKLLGDGARWQRVVRALRPPRLAAAVGRGEPAPRAAVVCVGCDLFYAGAGEQLDAAAQLLRTRLGEVARDWGLALPVYVVFTKADRIPHFEAWAATLAREEARAPLGAALPFDPDAAAGGYAERLAPRVDAAFRRLAESLAGWRLALLGRESVPERRLAAYELPREVGKLVPAATRFLTELCRPTQLGVSPMLRGFYFVGVRPVVVTDAAAAPAMAAAPAAAGARGATSVFAPPVALGGAPGAGAPGYAPPASRRVPQWTFLDRLFPDVVLSDAGAAAAARGGTRVSGLRRALLGTGIAAALLVAAGVGVSWARNRSLAARAEGAARAVAALPVVTAPAGTVVFPSAEALRTLDGLRAVLDTVGRWDADGPPLSMRWGLWRGGALRDAAEPVWLAGYRRQLHAVAWGALVDSLRALPDAPRPADDYGLAYADLKAYLILTAEPARSTPEFLAPVLLRDWQRGQPLDADVTALARRQFEHFAALLQREPRANPFPQAADAALVRRARDFLGRFAGPERIYQYMLAEASKAAPPARLAALAPQAAGVVSAPDVPGAFTAEGWKFMDGAFRNSDRFFQGERWVVGDAGAAQAQDKDRVLAELRARYRADYVAQWRQYVRALAVARPAGVRDAAQKLGALSGAQSPLLAAIALVARNTAVDSGVRAAFQPAHVVTPAEVTDKFVSPANEAYVNALVGLRGTLEQVAGMPPATDTAGAQALAQAATQAQMTQVPPAKAAARQLAGKFAVDTAAAAVRPALEALLLAPIEGAEVALRAPAAVRPPRVAAKPAAGAPTPPVAPANAGLKPAELAAQLNARGALLCADLRTTLAKFPFTPDATAEATLAEVKDLLAPGKGKLWVFQQERLAGLLEKQGAAWAPRPDAPVALSQTFVDFFNRAAAVSAALFPNDSPEPRVELTVRGVIAGNLRDITLTQGGQTARFGREATSPAQLVWPSQSGREARLVVRVDRAARGDRDVTVARESGEWALFRVFARAAKVQGGRAEWAGREGADAVALTYASPSGNSVLERGWLGAMGCSPQVTR